MHLVEIQVTNVGHHSGEQQARVFNRRKVCVLAQVTRRCLIEQMAGTLAPDLYAA
jgi:hypothetical protein